jgi:hypothetical protein
MERLAEQEQRPWTVAKQWKGSHAAATPEDLAELATQGRRRGLLYVTTALTGCAGPSSRACAGLGDHPTVTRRGRPRRRSAANPLPLDAELAARLLAQRQELAREHGHVPAPPSG